MLRSLCLNVALFVSSLGIIFFDTFISSPVFLRSIPNTPFSQAYREIKKMSNSIKVYVVGAMHMAGTSAKGAYDFAELKYLVPATPLNTANCTRSVAGMEVVAISVSDKSLIFDLQRHTFPLELNLELSPDSRNVQRNVCTGFSVVAPLNLAPNDKIDPLKKFGTA